VPDTLIIPHRCNGPPDSANGGYACGLVAARLDGGASVALRAPPPLERVLEVRRGEAAVRVLDGEALIAEGRPGEPDLEPPEPPSLEEAERASRRGRERWAHDHPFPTCVTCGPDREPGDGLRIFPGELPGRDAFAAPWTPAPSLADRGVPVPAPWLWAALDCPSSAPVLLDGGRRPPCVLATLTARILGPVAVGEPHLAVSWLLGREGRKNHSGSALFTADGELRGIARALWIELRQGSAR
jgi:hypothetical protein